jgi:histidinol dehydrogenase
MPNNFEVKVWKTPDLPSDWLKRVRTSEKENATLEKTVKDVINAVREKGDSAIIGFTEKFDKTKLNAKSFQVTHKEIKEAYNLVTEEQVEALKLVKSKLEALEKQTLLQQPTKSVRDDITVQTVLRPLESVGCYVPGGRAAYPSTLVMTATPAKVAGVSRIVVCSPPTEKGTINPLILVASDICGVDEVYKVGGVQAIAALAYGTETIRPVRKIVGPGSKYVTMAKVLVSQDIAIDMPAGPSEVLILADETANPSMIAADMISQAEHGADSVAGLITTSKKLADQVIDCLKTMVEKADRKEIVEAALSKQGFIIICEKAEEMVPLANAFASEHLEIITRQPKEIADKMISAGLILIGAYSPVALSDYGSGTNHVLPTGGFGNSFSGLSALDFTRRVSIVESTKAGLQKVKGTIRVLTEAERLPNHYKAVETRFDK